MNDTMLKWIAGVMSTLAAGACITAIVMWADVRQMKVQFQEDRLAAVKADRITKLEGDMERHEDISKMRMDAFNERYGDLADRVKDLEQKRAPRAARPPVEEEADGT